ncbi:hypothetical protein [Mesoplasma lactucae]|uniref:Uncharacterized protein n=1 Tax=Mesoplasma lactucae ATCC 49193 TaxID=81460 RepID=A0A291IRI4_9MOLU|nr:hypothetical protein [Mesoplasma lactucae]ATG97370.1 hypothetical protein CP520_01180 [Mesoplasma lactucae ATCC 49193]ATZ20178.1 hypothetical protein MLACT_v1c03570 [Mesoplasma lactucae ATCC 49193]MCL8216927.1 hypothetical protein [Mesoplasma lactucae ATCC 49193]
MNSGMIISGFVLATVVAIIVGLFVFSTYRSIKQIYAFKKQGLPIFEDKKVFKTLLALLIVICLFYIAALILFIVYECIKDSHEDASKIVGYIFECLFLIEIVFAIAYILVSQKQANALIIAIKNNTLISSSDIIDRNSITKISESNHRKYLYIDYRDKEITGNIKRMKVIYSWQLKDFLNDNGFWK